MKIAVTGSHGLVGTALLRRLRADGHEVVRLVRYGSAGGEQAGIRWDPSSGTIEAERLEGLDAVVHLAAKNIGDGRWTPARKEELVRSRVTGTGLLARTLAELDRPPPVLLSASAVGWYGDRGDQLVTEASGPGTGFFAELCRDWEDATAPASDAGIRVTHLRSGVVLSPEGGMLAKLLPFFRLGLGGRLGSGRQYLAWIFLDDEIAAIRFLLDHQLAGPVNLTSPEPVTNRVFTAALARVLRRPAIVPIPLFGPKLLYGSELVEETIVPSQRVVPERLLDAGFGFAHPDIEQALRSVLDRDGPAADAA
ncbi:MAG: TIGR01777 family oxidoreductase [Acidimicrobiia bacterium]|nr:TIGR01777 family oxidoreductase [Acidimicrobiia bacterium]